MRGTILLPASVGAGLLLACVLTVFASLASVPAASAQSSSPGASFYAKCKFSHRASDDPIVHPSDPGAAHSHDFFGNTTTSADPTYERMLGQGTTCLRLADTAAYWIPTVSWNGEELTANRAVFGYRAGGKDHTQVEPYPENLKIITAKGISWYCGKKGQASASAKPPSQCESGVLGLRIVFPDCSDGQVDGVDHRSHMGRSMPQGDGSRICPSTHPIPVPTLTVNINFPLPTTTGQVTLSSDHHGDPPGSTMHADFWNTWDQTELERLVVECINEVPISDPRPDQCQAATA